MKLTVEFLIFTRKIKMFDRIIQNKTDFEGDNYIIIQDGWGGRIRTSAWRNQNPLPYRLATPQGLLKHLLKELLGFVKRKNKKILKFIVGFHLYLNNRKYPLDSSFFHFDLLQFFEHNNEQIFQLF